MSQFTGSTSHPFGGSGAGRATRACTALLRRAAGWPLRAYRARQMMLELGRLGDHELRDIGLTRLDLQAASALPLDADPSTLLRRRSEACRRRR